MTPKPDASAPTVAHKTKLLLVDDLPANLLALEAVLSGPDYDLLFARSGPEALQILQEHQVALVLLDLQMPGMDGFETARRMKQMEHGRDVPIIFVTAVFREDPYVKMGYEAGAVDYFSKPFDPDILRLKVGLYASFRQKQNLMREREKRIRETEELLRAGRKLSAVLETLPIGVLIADAQGRVCQINEEVSRIWGGRVGEQEHEHAYGEFLGWWTRDGQLIKAANGPLERALSLGESSHNELTRIRCLDGTVKTVLNSASPLRSLEGGIVGVVVVIQDVTEHEQIGRDMERRIQSLISAGVELVQSAAPH
jgi:PAS domain S-box-containing protein